LTPEPLLEKTDDFSSNSSDQHSKEELKVQYLAQILHQQEVDEKLADPSAEDMKKYYNENLKSFIIPESVKVSVIWIDQGQNGDKKEQAKEKAIEALSMVKNTVDFAEVAQVFSENSLENSGSLIEETYYLDHLPNELGKAIGALEVGGTSDIIDYNEGFYIVKLIDKTPKKQMTYEESMNTIQEHLKEIKHNDLESEMENVLLKNANFTIYNRTLRKLIKEQKTS
jgi:parvulin-like peptidyl-prolyl isomerase